MRRAAAAELIIRRLFALKKTQVRLLSKVDMGHDSAHREGAISPARLNP
jgi:hypothetical protein